MSDSQESPPGPTNTSKNIPEILLSYHDINEVPPSDIKKPLLATDATTDIHDGGDAKQLKARDQERELHYSGPATSQGLDGLDKDEAILSHTGSGFQDEPAVIPDELHINTDSLPHVSLEEQLRDAVVASAWLPHQNKMFLPLDKLDTIINPDSVEEEVRSWNLGEGHDVKLTTKAIWKKHSIRDKDGTAHDGKFCLTSRRRLFAILLMVGNAKSILGLIDEFIFDRHLPFYVDPQKKTMKMKRNKDQDLEEVAAFSSWPQRDIDLFGLYQWQLLAPYFALSSKAEPKIHTYTLEGLKPLPFIMDPTMDQEEDNSPAFGGFGEVRRVKIHEGHTNQQIKYVAMKTLMNGSKQAFDIEVGALKRLIQEKHNPHVTRLLVAIEHGNNMSLMFPWAEGNLLQFWDKNPLSTAGHGDASFVRWMAKQFAGLASVIELIHGPTKFDYRQPQAHNHAASSSHIHLQLPTEYGRHGDLKPENILFFLGAEHDDGSDVNDPSGESLGILKVADFGLAAFHTRNSEKVKASQTARSKTYRAPEYDSTVVTACADLWSFGCILLEFLVWYQHGISGVLRFGRARLDDERGTDDMNEDYTEDKFFMRCPHLEHPFQVKHAVVREIASLRQGSKCGAFCNDVLDLIESGLLQVNFNSRLQCDQVHKSLQDIHRSALESAEYCTRAARPSYASTLVDTASTHHAASRPTSLSPSTDEIPPKALPRAQGREPSDSENIQPSPLLGLKRKSTVRRSWDVVRRFFLRLCCWRYFNQDR